MNKLDFNLSKNQRLFQEKIKKFCETEIKPIANKIDKEEYYSKTLYKKMGDLGLLGMTIPKEYGGLGIDRICYMIALEEISRFSGTTGIIVEAHNSLGVGHVYERGTDGQRKKYLPILTNGQHIAAWALTEPNAGSDAAAIQTTHWCQIPLLHLDYQLCSGQSACECAVHKPVAPQCPGCLLR